MVELPGRSTVGAEALLRWTAPWGGNVPALTTVAVAEQCGLIGALGRWVIQHAARHVTAERWVTVNLSPLQATSRLPEIVRQALSASDVPAAGLRFELTHGVLPEGGVGVLARVRDLGCRVGLSDFGSARSSALAELLRLPLDYLKLDPSLVGDLAHDPQQRAVVRGILDVASTLELDVIAEGVEREAQSDALVQLGARVQQGNLFARPRAEAPISAR